jgi:regulator of sigma E protease
MAILALSVLVIAHEFGHFIIAKLSGVWVEEFGVGLPPKIWGKKIGDTVYSINAFPFGGFVRLHGETGDAKITNGRMAYLNKSRFTRILIALGGIIMNYLLAIIAFSLVFISTGIAKGIKIVDVAPNSPAQEIGLHANDKIVSFAGKKIRDYDAFYPLVAQNIGKTVDITISRNVNGRQQQSSYKINLRANPPQDQGSMGIIYSPDTIYKPPFYTAPFVYTYYGVVKTADVSSQILSGFKIIFTQLSGGTIPKGVAGPVGVTAIMTEIAKLGILPLIEFSGIISINLALLNLIPFPPLDGSRVVFIISEFFISKTKIQKYENYIYTAGFAVLIGLLVLLTANEVPKLIRAHSLSNFVDNLVSQ